MQNGKVNISERLLNFAVEIIRFSVTLNKTPIGRHISLQLTRSATSSGANYEEACGAASRDDFIHKMQLVLKELRESKYWLRLISKSEIYSGNDLEIFSKEAEELIKIIAKSVITAKNRK